MSLLSTPRRRARRVVATTAVAGLGAAALALVPTAPAAQAAETDEVVGGTLTWGMSAFLGSDGFGLPNPYADGYASPATFDPDTRLTTWSLDSATVDEDGSAELAFSGTSVNFAKTSGNWLKLADPEVDVDEDGNGTVTALVAYGDAPGGYPVPYDDSFPARPTERVTVLELAGNSADDRSTAPGSITWTGLESTWSEEFLDYIDGDAEADPAIGSFVYHTEIHNDGDDVKPLPLTIAVDLAVPEVTLGEVVIVPGESVAVPVSGTGFRGVTNPGDNGVYVGIAPSGGFPDLDQEGGMEYFAGADHVGTGGIVDGAFTVEVVAAADRLDPRKSYSVYTWQAHAHSNSTQDTETPVTIDWAQLGYPISAGVLVSFPKTPTPKKAGKLKVAVGADLLVPSGKVDVKIAKGKKKKRKVHSWTRTLKKGAVTLRVPKLAKGRWKVTVTYRGDAAYAKKTVRKTLRVKKK